MKMEQRRKLRMMGRMRRKRRTNITKEAMTGVDILRWLGLSFPAAPPGGGAAPL